MSAPAEKAKDEYDVINLAETKCKPAGFTKWDRTWVDRGELTLAEFLNVFKEITGVIVFSLEGSYISKPVVHSLCVATSESRYFF